MARHVRYTRAMRLRILLFSALFADSSQAVTVSMGDTVIAQLATGGSWKTTIQLINMGTKPAQYTINFYDDAGSPLMLPLGGSGRVTSVSGQLSAGASRS